MTTSSDGAISIHFDRNADVFDTQQQTDRPTPTTGDALAPLADWKGEPRGRPEGGRGMGERRSREPRAHESARAFGALAPFESTRETAQSLTFHHKAYQ